MPAPIVPTLLDGEVLLRGLRHDDAPALREQATDELSIAWTNVPSPYTLAMAEDFCTTRSAEVWATGSEWLFALEVDGAYAGNLALRDEGHGVAEIAYGAHPAARGTGAMERGVRLLLDWGFAHQGLATVVWRANVGNWASRKLAWRVGFGVDGVLRASHVFRGGLVDAWMGTLTAGEPRSPRHPWLGAPTLEADGVRLRAFAERDLVRVVEACSDPVTQQWLGRMPAPYTEADARAFVASISSQQAEGRGSTWAVVDAETDELVGSANLFDLDPDVVCELGWWVHPDARGRGVATRAARRLTDWAFTELGVTRVRAVVAVDNVASCRVAQAVGMRRTGEERAALEVRHGRADAALYDLLVEEWRSSRPARSPLR